MSVRQSVSPSVRLCVCDITNGPSVRLIVCHHKWTYRENTEISQLRKAMVYVGLEPTIAGLIPCKLGGEKGCGV